MKNLCQIITIVFIAAFVNGCANSQLQADIDALKAQMQDVSAQAAEANERSKAAEATAYQAEQTAYDTNSKLDRMFKKSMMK